MMAGGQLGIRAFAACPALVARMGRRVAPSTVTRWGQDGKIVLVGEGRAAKVDVAASLARLDALGVGQLRPDVAARHAHEAAQDSAQRAQSAVSMSNHQPGADRPAPRNTGATTDATDTDLAGVDTGGAGKARYKSAAVDYENKLSSLGLQLAMGQRYDLAAVKDEAAALGNALRAAVERLTDQSAPRLAVLHNPIDRASLLRREVRRIKRLLNLEHAAGLRRLRRAGRGG